MRLVIGFVVLLLGVQVAWADELKQAQKAYRHGQYAEAAAILQPLAQRGNPIAQFNVAVMYDDGLGLPQNLALALSWYKRAGEAGLIDGQYMTGRFYGRGRGTPQNPGKALFWFDLARAGGHPLAGKLRDQHWDQLNSPQRDAIEAEATRWHARHPHQFSCKGNPCIYPRWTPKPRWSIFDLDTGPQ
jgi:TPR repeat protein